MFAKVFYQIFESSISEDYMVRHVFIDLLVLSDSDGVIDKTASAISRITNVPIEIVERAISQLCEPDPNSRTPDHEGRRLMTIDEHRKWGWKIVNYHKYRSIRDEEARRLSNRSYKRDQRARQRQLRENGVLDSQQRSARAIQCQPMQKREAEAEAEAVVQKSEINTQAVPTTTQSESANSRAIASLTQTQRPNGQPVSRFVVREIPTNSKPEPTPSHFPEFWERWPKKVYEQQAAQMWLSWDCDQHAGEVKACFDSFVGSEEAERGIVGRLDKWIDENARNKWQSRWVSSVKKTGDAWLDNPVDPKKIVPYSLEGLKP
jgi:hypothetical protein